MSSTNKSDSWDAIMSGGSPGGHKPTPKSKTGSRLAASSSKSKQTNKSAAKNRPNTTKGPKLSRGAKPARPKSRVKTWLKRIALTIAAGCAVVLAAGLIAFAYLYSTLDIPGPDKFATAQNVPVYFADGKTPLGTLAERNRDVVDYKTLPKYVGQAVVASEDKTFFENVGVDIKGIIRALYNNVTGGKRQGASTITQQYVERYYLGQTGGYFGKIKESILALKISREQSKEEILGNYLNTIYWGRGAYGIEAASQAYFGKPAKSLTISEAALLSGIIPAPSQYDPAVSLGDAQGRWKRVLELMVTQGWIRETERAGQTFPKTIAAKNDINGLSGTNGYLIQHVRQELFSKTGLTEDQAFSMGIKVTTTIDVQRQKDAVAAVGDLPQLPEGVRVALTSIDSDSGGIVAEYGGADYSKIQSNSATQDIAMAGSTFKAFTLIAALEDGISLNDRFNGNSPVTFNGKPVRNFGGVSYGQVSLAQATANSVNTAYMAVNEKVGPDRTKDIAIKAGIPEDTIGLNNELQNTLGTSAPHNVDLAQAFSTIAAQGIKRDAHIIALVKDDVGDTIYKADSKGKRVFDEKITAQATEALQSVVRSGSGTTARALGRPTAAKTGSSEKNLSAQFVGFVPQLTTAVSMYNVGKSGESVPLPSIGGYEEVTGSTLPAEVFTQYMKAALKGVPIMQFVRPDGSTLPAPTTTVPAPSAPAPSAPAPAPSPSSASPTPPKPTPPSPTPTPTKPTPPSPTPTPTKPPGAG